MSKQLISSGTSWENKYNYSRAVKAGNMIFLSGTTAVDEQGSIVGQYQPYEQAIFIFQKIERALLHADAALHHVVRVRAFVTNAAYINEVAEAHGAVFKNICPALTIVVVSALIHQELLVEIEADAVID